jgi:hypothetical protein
MSSKPANPVKKPAPRRGRRGFVQTSGLLSNRIRQGAEARGFAQTKLLTQWTEIVGPELAQMARPVKVTFGTKTLGGTLVILTKGAQAPMVQMQTPLMLDRVNAAYGYKAISKIRVTQTAATGFHEPKTSFEHATPKTRPEPSPEKTKALAKAVSPVQDEGLKAALEMLGKNILTRTPQVKGTH